jgi:LysM repeat protein
MSRKVLAQISVLVLLLLAFLGTPFGAQAGGVCGGTYVVEQGETVDTLAARCGTSASAIYAANPGISGNLYVGQVLTLPGSNYNNQGNSTIVDYNSNTYPVYAPVNTSGTYIVRYGDTFSGIASRYGVSINSLWAANPFIRDINFLYAGQVLYVPVGQGYYVPAPYGYAVPPAPYGYAVVSTPTETPVALSYGTAPSGTPNGRIQLSNKANGDVYVSLQGTTRDGVSVINEYPVSGTMNVKVPAGWYVYVAWVGGQKFTGQFNLGGDSDHSITFYSNKVVVN